MDCYKYKYYDERFWFNAEEKKNYTKIKNCFKTPKGIMNVLIELIGPNKTQILIEGSTKKPVSYCWTSFALV